jgi:hypothetical protein
MQCQPFVTALDLDTTIRYDHNQTFSDFPLLCLKACRYTLLTINTFPLTPGFYKHNLNYYYMLIFRLKITTASAELHAIYTTTCLKTQIVMQMSTLCESPLFEYGQNQTLLAFQ